MQKFKYLTGKKVGLTTIRKILKRYNLPSRIARKKPFLSKKTLAQDFFGRVILDMQKGKTSIIFCDR